MRKEAKTPSSAPQFELVEITTKDGFVHQGMVAFPEASGRRAVLWVHGLVSRFYSDVGLMNDFARACTNQGMAFAAFNNRGHDYVTSTHKIDANDPKGYVHERIGSSVEQFTDAPQDIDAAITYLSGRGYDQVILAGHSTGANKVCYYAGTIDDPRVSGVVLAGPMSDRYSATDEETNKKHRAFMEQSIREGKGDELFSGFDFFPLTPKRWMSLLGEGSPEDVFNYRDPKGALATFGKIKKPLLVLFAGDDEHADRSIPDIQKAFDARASATNYTSVVFQGADHGFTGKERAFVESIVSWGTALAL